MIEKEIDKERYYTLSIEARKIELAAMMKKYLTRVDNVLEEKYKWFNGLNGERFKPSDLGLNVTQMSTLMNIMNDEVEELMKIKKANK